MNIVCVKDYDTMSRTAAAWISEKIKERPWMNLGLATGSTPLKMYQYLARECRMGKFSMKGVKGFNLDEYIGLPKEHEQSFYRYLKQNLVDTTDMQEKNLYVIDGMARNMKEACREYERKIADAGGIELQILGIGMDGHIGFNEPDDYFPTQCHSTKLDEKTRKDNARFFKSLEEVPTEAATMGIGTIMKASELLLMVNGGAKGKILAETLFGHVTPKVPGSIIQFHPKCTVLVEQEAWEAVEKEKSYQGRGDIRVCG